VEIILQRQTANEIFRTEQGGKALMCLAVFILYSANGYLLLIKMIKEGQPNVKDFLKNQKLLHIL